MYNCFRFLLIALFIHAANADEGFPGHKLYHDISIITLEQLARIHQDAYVVDVRTPYEYSTIHIKGALNIPLSGDTFTKEVTALRSKNAKKKVIFYCNGHTCFKSYKAARRAQVFGIKDCHSFDGGVFDWANAHPDKTVLLGKSPIDKSKLIPKKSFKSKLLSPGGFDLRTKTNGYFVLDVRSRMQRAAMGLFPFIETWASLDDEEEITAV